jgi:mono/diheme cytochrome c family protein
MLRYLKYALWLVLVVLAVAQVFRIDRTNPPIQQDVAAPPEVARILHRACYDCHSNETVWPGYSHVAPVSWLVARDVREGRRDLNFSAWNTYDAKKKAKKLKETADEVAEGEMPPWYYVLTHRDATLSPADTERLRAWTADEMAKLGR